MDCRVVDTYVEGARKKTLYGFKSTGITKAIQSVGLVLERIENLIYFLFCNIMKTKCSEHKIFFMVIHKD